jgi:hypothetical protein
MASRGQSSNEARRLQALLEKAKRFARDHYRGPEAIDVNTEILELDPEQVGSYTRRGSCYVAANNLDAAKKDFEKALALDPKNRIAINRLRELKDRRVSKVRAKRKVGSKSVRPRQQPSPPPKSPPPKPLPKSPLPKSPPLKSPPDPIWVYHFTPVENLPGIIESEGLSCKNQCTTQQVSIAHEHIQDRRSSKRVPCWPGGNLHDYVPFYFCYRSPMMYAIKGRRVASYDRGQGELVYLVLKLQAVAETGLKFIFTDRHAVTDHVAFYTDPDDLGRVDWDLMSSSRWNDIPEYLDRKDRRQAEFLVHAFVPWDLVAGLAVMTSYMKEKVERLLARYPTPSRRPVVVRRGWYY